MLQYPESGYHTTPICDLLVLCNDTNVANDNNALLPVAAKVKLEAVDDFVFFIRGSAYKVEKGEENELVLVQKISTTFGISMRVPTQHSANQTDAA